MSARSSSAGSPDGSASASTQASPGHSQDADYGVAPSSPPAATILAEPLPARPPTSPAAVRKSALLLALAALFFSGMALCAKQASARISGPQVAFMRFVFGLSSLVVPLLSGRRLQPKNLWALSLRGLFGGAAVLLYFGAIAHLPVGIATLLNSSSPLFVALFSTMFLHEPLGPRMPWALLLTSVGVTLVVLGGSSGRASPLTSGAGSAQAHTLLLWSLVGLASAVFSGAAVTTIRSMRQREGSWEIFLMFSLLGGVITGVPSALAWVTPTLPELGWVLAMGLLSVGAQLLMTHALRDVPAVSAMLILQLTPLSTLIFGALLLPDRPAPIGWFGAALTLAGVTWGMLAQQPAAAAPKPR